MNKIVIISLTEEMRMNVDAGGIDLRTADGLREAMSIADRGRAALTDALINTMAAELAAKKDQTQELAAKNAEAAKVTEQEDTDNGKDV